MVSVDYLANILTPATQEKKDLFLNTLRSNGEVYVNYLMGATLHYVLEDLMVCEKQDYDGSIFGCFNILDAEEKFDTWIDLQGVASITSYNLIK